MDIRTLVAECQLDAALALAESVVRSQPLNFRHRTTLFSLLAFTGQYERAEQQLTVLSQESDEVAKGVATYRSLLAAQCARDRVLGGLEPGSYLLQPPNYAADHALVVSCAAQRDLVGARRALDVLTEQRPLVTVQVGAHRGWVSDADDRLGPVVELFLQGRYVWLPWEQLRGMHIPRPTQLCDLLWTPVVVDLEVGQMQAFMPVLYPGAAGAQDSRISLGRITTWQDNEQGVSLGEGARLLTLHMPTVEQPDNTDEWYDIPILEVDSLQQLDAVSAGPNVPGADPVSALSGAA